MLRVSDPSEKGNAFHLILNRGIWAETVAEPVPRREVNLPRES